MSRFDTNAARVLSAIPIKRRGTNRECLPFQNKANALLIGLKRAEKGYQTKLEEIQESSRYRAQLTKIFDQQESFAQLFAAMMRSWNSLEAAARNDLADVAHHYLALLNHRADNLHEVRSTSDFKIDQMVDGFDNMFHAMELAASTRVSFDQRRKKDRKKNGVDNSSFREFAYQFKLFWDDFMVESYGANGGKLFPFSTGSKIVIAAIAHLTGDRYRDADYAPIKRDLQSSAYLHKKSSSKSTAHNLLSILRSQLPQGPLQPDFRFEPGQWNLGENRKRARVRTKRS